MTMPQIPESKTLAFVFLGIILYLGILYVNGLNNVVIEIFNTGVILGTVLIVIGIIAQILNFILYFKKKLTD